jgi:hypothetical protein
MIMPPREPVIARDVFLYVISGFKKHNPAAAMALIRQLAADATQS